MQLAVDRGTGRLDVGVDCQKAVTSRITAVFRGAGTPVLSTRPIEALKPYKGGNNDLWSLHQLDIMRKHPT